MQANKKSIEIISTNASKLKSNIVLPTIHSIDNYCLLIIILSTVLLFWGVFDDGTQNLVAHDEAIYAGRAKLIIDSNDWFTPFNSPHHKTIGSYWPIALSYRLFGINEASARLPSLIFSILNVVLIYQICCKFCSKKSSFIGACSLLSMPLWIQYSRYSSPDMIFVFSMLLSLFCFINSIGQNLENNSHEKLNLFFSGLFISTAFFLRSFMVFLPTLSLLPFFCIKGNLLNSKRIQFIIFGILIGLIPTIISIYLAINLYGSEALINLYTHASEKASGDIPFNGFFFYPVSILLFSYPGSILSFLGFKNILARKNHKYFLLIAITPLIILSLLLPISAKHSHYSLIIYPYLAFLISYTYDLIFKDDFSISIRCKVILQLLLIFVGSILIILSSAFISNPNLFNLDISKSVFYVALILGILNTSMGLLSLLNNYRTRSFLLAIFAICFVQSIAINLLYAQGAMGNPNPDFKAFITQKNVYENVYNKNVYLVNIHKKTRSLSQFYFPQFTHIGLEPSKIEANSIYFISSDQIKEVFRSFDFKIISSYKDYLLVNTL